MFWFVLFTRLQLMLTFSYKNKINQERVEAFCLCYSSFKVNEANQNIWNLSIEKSSLKQVKVL